MTKIITVPTSFEEIDKSITLIDGFIIGIKDMCVNTNLCIENLSRIKKYSNKEIFVVLNKNMHNSDLKKIETILLELNNYNIKGVLYYDVGVLNIYNKLELNYGLVWSSEHMVTNYNTINYWNKFGVNYAYLSSDITEEEIKIISKNSKVKLMVNMFGHLPMFVSKRHIVGNYLDYFNIKDKSEINYMEKEGKIYPLIDNAVGTVVYSNNILNGLSTYLNIDVEYIVLNSFGIDSDLFLSVVEMFKTVNKKNLKDYNEKINSMFMNIDNGFLNTKTIYRVKKHEK